MDIGVWLQGLGLEQYAAAFLDNAIDAEVLRDLTADDLKDLGVNLVGHRRKLLAAIAALKTEASPAPRKAQSNKPRRRPPPHRDKPMRSAGNSP